MLMALTAKHIRAPLARRHPRARGLTLIEVLVALLVLSIGLLGFAGLQAASLTLNHSAFLRTQASNLAYDIADRMRANRGAALDGDYDLAFGKDAGDLADTTVAEQDLKGWLELVEGNLTEGDAEVSVGGGGCAGCATVTIRWLDDRETETTVDFEYNTRL